jgi:putative component of membrane protein insertase Oxa1/YidC/SpoIIIJ protein YidD
VLLTFFGRSQATVSSQLSTKLIANCGTEKPHVKPFLNLTSNKAKINPLTYVAGGLLFLYQNVLSEQISANCNFEISCSEYTKRSINEYGIVKGVFVGLHQLSCCSPTIYKDYCEYQLSENGKVKNEVVK